MEHEHPIVAYSKRTRRTITEIAEAAGCSRMQLYRVMRGESTTVALLRRISEATNGEVSVVDCLGPNEGAAA